MPVRLLPLESIRVSSDPGSTWATNIFGYLINCTENGKLIDLALLIPRKEKLEADLLYRCFIDISDTKSLVTLYHLHWRQIRTNAN